MIANTSHRLFAVFESVGHVPVLAWTEHQSPLAAVPVSNGQLRVAAQLPGFRYLVEAEEGELTGWSVYPETGLEPGTAQIPATTEVDPRIIWADRADGLVHELVQGIHFRRPAAKVQRAAIMWAGRNGYTATTRISGGSVTVKFVPRVQEV